MSGQFPTVQIRPRENSTGVWSGVLAGLLAQRSTEDRAAGGGLLLLLDAKDGTTVRTSLKIEAGGVRVLPDHPLDPEAQTTIVLGTERDWEALLFARDPTALRRLRFLGDHEPMRRLAQMLRSVNQTPSVSPAELWH